MEKEKKKTQRMEAVMWPKKNRAEDKEEQCSMLLCEDVKARDSSAHLEAPQYADLI